MSKNKSIRLMLLVFLVFFVISFITNILGTLNDPISESFQLSDTMVGFLPFAFFIAYGVFSVPAGVLVEKYGQKSIMTGSFILIFLGTLLFALFSSFTQAMVSLFVVGAGMAALQVVINPLLRESGGEEHFAFNSVIAQLVFGGASYVAPFVYNNLVEGGLKSVSENSNFFIQILHNVTPISLQWVSMYWVFAIISLILVAIIMLSKFPKVKLQKDEKFEGIEVLKKLLRNKTVILFFLGLFAYVGLEQGISFWIAKFLIKYHGTTNADGSEIIGFFWGMMTLGCFLGLILLKLLDSKLVLKIFTAISMLCLALALFGSKQMAMICFPAVGFFISVMYSVVFSLGLNSLKDHHGTFSGILCAGIAGGAVIPFIVGGLADVFGTAMPDGNIDSNLKVGMLFNYVPLLYIFSIGIWAKPLVKNKTISAKVKESDNK